MTESLRVFLLLLPLWLLPLFLLSRVNFFFHGFHSAFIWNSIEFLLMYGIHVLHIHIVSKHNKNQNKQTILMRRRKKSNSIKTLCDECVKTNFHCNVKKNVVRFMWQKKPFVMISNRFFFIYSFVAPTIKGLKSRLHFWTLCFWHYILIEYNISVLFSTWINIS